jgi:hypothetical protein
MAGYGMVVPVPIYGSASVYLPQLHLQLHVSLEDLFLAAQSWYKGRGKEKREKGREEKKREEIKLDGQYRMFK